MSQAHVLHVCTQAEVVGQLEFDAREDRYGFQYTRSWLDSRMAYYLAPAIPLIEQSAGTGAVHRFLENLLPEGRALDIASIHNQVSKSNTFALIRLLGKEPVGAFSFMAHDASPEEAARIVGAERHRPPRRPISNEELSQRIRERDAIPFPVWDGKVRLSLAGYQDKLQVLVEGEQLSLADGPLSSTHLLKPESRNPFTPCMVANEHFCMSLAARLRLPVAPVAIRRIPEPILLIERFDRTVVWDDAQPGRAQSVNRLHVIDGCQALDLPSTFKYERNFGAGADVRNIREGVSFARVFTLLDKMVTPATARPVILRWAILQLLLGNSDAHGKNISFHVHSAGLSPAPMYDLVSVNVYGERVESDMAMAYGDAFLLEEITPYALADFAHRTGTPFAQLAREIGTMAHSMLRMAPELAASDIYIGDERDLVRQIADFVCAQATRLIALAREVPKVDRRLFG
ncbi:HipA domain-containing protein [Ralstonia solanacearum]|uniref:HipA domain-containing protein n=1 Tax=Ralstonia solanacearum TaxID=305 RepID=UPI000F60F7D3|nr:HipA domain-containing protein [Ralstonia solanacearum]MCL9843835.1 HipA domain-containing protein [Ralstonia solanacearum]MDC6252037.1 HipA domain-containing protein [Ralstonia solanacearum]MDC6256862.1 HipA domain-containing protein [Ralstonia solanacearum]MDC6301280.1 HipA domain-containing protein [Ralstonia solanacearum]